jgi:protein-S-isoprenylcysteine O-methyltransferase Ste14
MLFLRGKIRKSTINCELALMETISTSKNNFLFYWLIESIVLFLWVVFHFFLPISSLQFDDAGLRFAENQDYVYLFYLWVGYLPYSLITHKLKSRTNEQSRIERLINGLKNKKDAADVNQILLVFAVKFFFVPLMYLGTLFYGKESYYYLVHFDTQVFNGKSIAEVFNFVIYPFIVYFAMFLALIVYLVGYIYESKKYKTTIISVESSWFGWIVTLICYAPFYPFLFYVFPNASQDFAFFKSQEITFVVRLVLSLILILKTITIFNLGLKSSNLTYRGIVTNGIYGWIRHPHYACKLMLWWIGLAPSAYVHPWLIGPMIFWSVIYYLRAVTEEQHLIRNDKAYLEYQKKVKYMFIPGVI